MLDSVQQSVQRMLLTVPIALMMRHQLIVRAPWWPKAMTTEDDFVEIADSQPPARRRPGRPRRINQL